jgi:hypothetical protein
MINTQPLHPTAQRGWQHQGNQRGGALLIDALSAKRVALKETIDMSRGQYRPRQRLQRRNFVRDHRPLEYKPGRKYRLLCTPPIERIAEVGAEERHGAG